jgi:hypothetical protein
MKTLFWFVFFVLLLIAILIHKSKKRGQLEEKQLKEYLDYCDSMKGKDTIKSFEEFKQDIVNLHKRNLDITEQQNLIRLANNARDSKLEAASHIPKCPTCGSPNIEKIPVAVKVFFLGPFAPLYKTYKCNNCKCKW